MHSAEVVYTHLKSWFKNSVSVSKKRLKSVSLVTASEVTPSKAVCCHVNKWCPPKTLQFQQQQIFFKTHFNGQCVMIDIAYAVRNYFIFK